MSSQDWDDEKTIDHHNDLVNIYGVTLHSVSGGF
jgi:hypothetical protein